MQPRFEEALLLITPDTTPTLLAGPENLGRAQNAAIEVEARLYPPFGLLGQAMLGIATLMLVVPLPLAVAHQAGAFILFSLGLYALHGLRRMRA